MQLVACNVVKTLQKWSLSLEIEEQLNTVLVNTSIHQTFHLKLVEGCVLLTCDISSSVTEQLLNIIYVYVKDKSKTFNSP